MYLLVFQPMKTSRSIAAPSLLAAPPWSRARPRWVRRGAAVQTSGGKQIRRSASAHPHSTYQLHSTSATPAACLSIQHPALWLLCRSRSIPTPTARQSAERSALRQRQRCSGVLSAESCRRQWLAEPRIVHATSSTLVSLYFSESHQRPHLHRSPPLASSIHHSRMSPSLSVAFPRLHRCPGH